MMISQSYKEVTSGKNANNILAIIILIEEKTYRSKQVKNQTMKLIYDDNDCTIIQSNQFLWNSQ